MSLQCYLAMTEEEIRSSSVLPPKLAYMACHFSPYGSGLTMLPQQLPKGSLLIVNDRIPVLYHDPLLIARQLLSAAEKLRPWGILLDFEQCGNSLTAEIVREVVNNLPLPVGVSENYAKGLTCPVFISPEIHSPLCQYRKKWGERPLWLDIAPQEVILSVTGSGCKAVETEFPKDGMEFFDQTLCCHYRINPQTDKVDFYLYRKNEDISKYLSLAKQEGFSLAVGLHQQLAGYI